MTFFNKKEEVIEIQLTSYGKYKLSKGKFEPTYYAFFDDDILYDPAYAGRSTSTDEEYTETRIQDETPSLRSQTLITGADLIMKKTKEIHNSEYSAEKYNNVIVDISDTELASLPIGSGEPSIDLAPAWSIRLNKGEIVSGSFSLEKQANKSMYVVPSIDINLTYTTNIYNSGDVYAGTSVAEREVAEQSYSQTMGTVSVPADNYLITYFNDGSVLLLDDGSILLDIQEKNVRQEPRNFDIEVYRMMPDSAGTSTMPLKFVKRPEEIVGDILLDADDIEIINDTEIDETYVEYFMDILADNEIDDNAVCNYIATSTVEQINWSRVLGCSGMVETEGSILYSDEELIGCEDE
ncbi:MAG TPA: hypothetical protein EYN67_09195 [Flavobacteriales bacterium]|nr:hypothetical protein [Flavobacteriales bacterium]